MEFPKISPSPVRESSPLELFDENTNQLIEGIEDSHKKARNGPTLILLYSSMDIMASIIRKNDWISKDQDFKDWANEYFLPQGNFSANADDLWAARCGTVHMFSSESALSKKKMARRIFYSNNEQEMVHLQRFFEFAKPKEEIILEDLSKLIEAFKKAVDKFRQKMQNNNFLNKYEKRIKEQFKYLSTSQTRNMLKWAKKEVLKTIRWNENRLNALNKALWTTPCKNTLAIILEIDDIEAKLKLAFEWAKRL